MDSNRKIEINKIEHNVDQHTIIFEIIVDGTSRKLWYDVRSDSEDFYIPNRVDAVVVTLLLFAMLNKYDIHSNYPISEKLYYQLTNHIIPQIHKTNINNAFEIKLNMPTTDKRYNPKYNATGVSCGVDSLTTIF